MLPHNSSLLVTGNNVRSASFTEKLGHVNNIFNFLLIFCIDSAARVKAESKVDGSISERNFAGCCSALGCLCCGEASTARLSKGNATRWRETNWVKAQIKDFSEATSSG